MEIGPCRADHPSLQALFDYWLSKRRGRPMPSRADLVVSEIKEHLGWISLLEVLPAEQDFRYRLIGTRVTTYFSADTTGQTVREAFSQVPEARDIMLAMLHQVVQSRIPIRTYGDLAWVGRELEDFESLFLPLSDDGEIVTGIMNPFVFDSGVFLKRHIKL